MWLPILILLYPLQAQEVSQTDVYWEDAKQFVENGQFDRAILPLQKLVEKDPTRENAFVLLGKSLYGVHRYEAALDAFRRALDLSSQKGPIQTWIGKTYSALKRWSELRLLALEIERQKDLTPEMELSMNWMRAKAAWELKDMGQAQKILLESEKKKGDPLIQISLRVIALQVKFYSCTLSVSQAQKASLDLRIRQNFNQRGTCLLEGVVRFMKLMADAPSQTLNSVIEPEVVSLKKEAETQVASAFLDYKKACQTYRPSKALYPQTASEKSEFDKEMREVLLLDFRNKQKEALALLTGSSDERVLSLRNTLVQL